MQHENLRNRLRRLSGAAGDEWLNGRDAGIEAILHTLELCASRGMHRVTIGVRYAEQGAFIAEQLAQHGLEARCNTQFLTDHFVRISWVAGPDVYDSGARAFSVSASWELFGMINDALVTDTSKKTAGS